VIELEGIRFARDGRTILDDVDLSLGSERVALVGPSGSGKSTLLRVLLGLEIPESGTVRVAGTLVSRNGQLQVPAEERNLAMVFQDLALWPHLSVRGNLEYGLKARAVAKTARAGRIAEALSWVGMRELEDRRPHELSGGERQRAALARALVLDPVALLLDEPLGSLDVVLKDELLALFARLFAERELPVLYVTHDPREARAIAQRIVVLERGRVTQQGSWSELERAPATPFARAFTR
jgi:iron(III) transport system ATP-binding protein